MKVQCKSTPSRLSPRRWSVKAVKGTEQNPIWVPTIIGYQLQRDIGTRSRVQGNLQARFWRRGGKGDFFTDSNITCKSRFYIQVPQQLSKDEQQDAIEQALITWKRDRAWQDIQHFAKVYAGKLGLKLPEIKLSEQKRVWGTCGKDGVIRINWQLIHAPLTVLEYVVAHEFVHLLHRHHGDAFWEAR